MAKRAIIGTVPSYLPGTTSASAINSNDGALNAAFDNTLSRDGSTPNEMNADFDMNSNDILNVNNLNTRKLILDGITVTAVAAAPVFEGVRVFQTVGTTGISGTPKVLGFDSEAYDTDGMHDNSVNNSRLIAKSAGFFIAICDFEILNTDQYELVALRIRKNGTDVIAQNIRLFEPSVSFNTAPAIQITSGPVKLIIGDYLEILAELIPTDDSLTGVDDGTWFSMYKLGT